MRRLPPLSLLKKCCLAGALLGLVPMEAAADSSGEAIDGIRRAMADHLPEIALQRALEVAEDETFDPDRRAELNLLTLEAAVRSGQVAEVAHLVSATLPDTGEADYWSARALLAGGLIHRAEERLEKLMQRGSGNLLARAALLRADLLILLREPEAALESVRIAAGATEASPLVRYALILEAELLLLLERIDEAVEALGKLSRTDDPLLAAARFYLEGRIALLRGEGEAAIAAFRSAIAADPPIPVEAQDAARIGIIHGRLQTGLGGDALDELVAFVNSRPQSPLLEQAFDLAHQIPGFAKDPRVNTWISAENPRLAALAALSLSLLQDSPADAVAPLREVLQNHPDDSATIGVRLELASLLLKNGDPEEAVSLLEPLRGATLTPAQESRLAYLEAVHHYESGRPREALEEFARAALGARPQDEVPIRFNTGVLAFLEDDSATFEDIVDRLSGSGEDQQLLAARLLLERGLYLSSRDVALARLMIWRYLRAAPDDPMHYRAEIVLAEIALREDPPAPDKARNRLVRIPEDAPPTIQEQRDYLMVWAADLEGDHRATIAAADHFLENWPESPLAAEILFKAAETEAAAGNHARSRSLFQQVARLDSPLREHALFQAARSSSLILTEAGLDQAIDLFQQVADLDGPLRFAARRKQAEILLRQGNTSSAISLLRETLDSDPAPEAEDRRALQAQLAETLLLDPERDEACTREALRLLSRLRQDPGASEYWRNRSAWFLGRAAEIAGDSAEALEIWYSVIDSHFLPGQPVPETYWSFRCAISAIELLGRLENWRAAAALAERIGRSEAPRAREARTIAQRIRLEHFLWEDGRLSHSDSPPAEAPQEGESVQREAP